jgi:hypothetical protein
MNKYYEPKEWKIVTEAKRINNNREEYFCYKVGETPTNDGKDLLPITKWMSRRTYDNILKGKFVIEHGDDWLVVKDPTMKMIVVY